MCLVEEVDAVGDGESEATRAVTFAMMVTEAACFRYQFVEWFDGRHAVLILNHEPTRVLLKLSRASFSLEMSITCQITKAQNARKNIIRNGCFESDENRVCLRH